MIDAGAPSIKYEGERPLKKPEMLMAGPDWYIKRIENLEFLGYSYEEAAEIAFDSDKYYEIVGMESKKDSGGIKRMASKNNLTIVKPKDFDDIIIYLILGIIIGGRLGYVFLYNYGYYSENFLEIFYKNYLLVLHHLSCKPQIYSVAETLF